MIKINLLPIRQMKKRVRTRNEVFALLVSLVVVVTALVMWNMSLGATVKTLQGDISRLQAEKTKYDAIIKEIKQIEAEKTKLTVKIDAIKKLKSLSRISVRLLDEIAKATPPDSIWLKSLKQSGTTVALDGTVLDNTRLAEYMERLTSSPYFSGATLGKSSLETVAGQNLKSFSLTLTVSEPESTETESSRDSK